MCAENLKRRKGRTFLTVLGVFIGCCSIIVMVSIGIGMTESQNQMLQNMGVVDGLNGIKIKSGKISGNDVVIEISYKVRLIFYIETFHFGEFESTQKVCCRLWK